MSVRDFLIPDLTAVLSGKTTDIYFVRVMEILKKDNRNPHVIMQALVKEFPDPNYNFAVLTGVNRVAKLLEGEPVNVYAMREGEIFFEGEPVMRIEGCYKDYGILENSILGFLSKSSGISTKASRVEIASKGKTVFEFGTRRADPFQAGVVSYAARVGGLSGLSNIAGAEMLGMKAVGTMPHLLMMIYGNAEEGFKAYDKYMPRDAPRIALIDTFDEPKEEVKTAIKVFGRRLEGVRIDSGDLKKNALEVRNILNDKGFQKVKLFASGKLDEYKVADIVDQYDGFGVGTAIADAPSLDFSLKPVEIDGKRIAKRGYITGEGSKDVYRYKWIDTVAPIRSNLRGESLLKPLLINGKIVRRETLDDIANFTKERIKSLPTELKNLRAKVPSRVQILG